MEELRRLEVLEKKNFIETRKAKNGGKKTNTNIKQKTKMVFI